MHFRTPYKTKMTGSTSNDTTGNSSAGGETRVICLFCSKKDRRVGSQRFYPILCSSKDACDKVMAFAETLNDTPMKSLVENSGTIFYHATCYASYQSKATVKIREEQKPGESRNIRQLHSFAFKHLENSQRII